MNVALWQHRWREYLSVRGYAQRTVDTYGAELKPFLGFLDSNGIAELSSVTRETLEAYRLHLIDHPEKRLLFGQNAYQEVRKKFDWNVSAKKYLAVFQKLLDNRE